MLIPFRRDPAFFQSRRRLGFSSTPATTSLLRTQAVPAVGSWVAPTSLVDLQTLLTQLQTNTPAVPYELVGAHTGIGGVYQSLKFGDTSNTVVHVSLQQVRACCVCFASRFTALSAVHHGRSSALV